MPAWTEDGRRRRAPARKAPPSVGVHGLSQKSRPSHRLAAAAFPQDGRVVTAENRPLAAVPISDSVALQPSPYPVGRARKEPALLIPLRSNGSSLLNGQPVESVRRRLKYATLSYERVLLEAGIYRLQAGPGGSWSVLQPPQYETEPRWQTAAHRHAAKATSFGLDMGRELTPGVPAPVAQTVLSSETAVSWAATLHPFVRELPADADWVELVRTRDPAGDTKRLSDEWTWADERNAASRAGDPRTVRAYRRDRAC